MPGCLCERTVLISGVSACLSLQTSCWWRYSELQNTRFVTSAGSPSFPVGHKRRPFICSHALPPAASFSIVFAKCVAVSPTATACCPYYSSLLRVFVVFESCVCLFQEWLGGYREVENGNGHGQGAFIDSFDAVSCHTYQLRESTVRQRLLLHAVRVLLRSWSPLRGD